MAHSEQQAPAEARVPAPPMPPRSAYEAWAASYDTETNLTRDLDARVLRAAGLPVEGSHVIEIGAGTGKNTLFLADGARQVIALDLSPAMLARARAHIGAAHVRFVEHDITRPWPVEDASADLVVGNLVLEHVADLRPVFAECRRVLAPGGLLFVAELHPWRQLRGAGARFRQRGQEVLVESFPHTVPDYVNGAIGADLAMVRLGEWRDAEADPPDQPPRLLTLLCRRPA